MPRKLILIQDQSPGDILTASRAFYDVKRTYPDWLIDVRSPCPAIFEHNPYMTPLDEADPDVEQYKIGYDDIHKSGWMGLHFAEAFRNEINRKLNSRPEMVDEWGIAEVQSTGLLPEIYLSDDEKAWYNQVHCEFFWDGPYWIINAGRKPDNELKHYHRWQEVVDILNEEWQGKVRVVQIGHPDHIHPKLTDTFDLIGKTDLRQLIRLAYWSAGLIGPISFQFVLAAAFHKPGIVIAGGKEGVRWHLYNHIQHVSMNGCLPCCHQKVDQVTLSGQAVPVEVMGDGCWLGGSKGQCQQLVDGIPLCFHITTPEHIAERVMLYYKGGVLEIPETEMWYEATPEERKQAAEVQKPQQVQVLPPGFHPKTIEERRAEYMTRTMAYLRNLYPTIKAKTKKELVDMAIEQYHTKGD
ncbi:MAG: glycosyltransferase family 9 protein [Candidatus Thorarchaeota archaeon]